jgi:hypothetical protein
MLVGTTVFIAFNNTNRVVASEDENYNDIFYVSASGNNANDGSENTPFETLSKTAEVINSLGTGGNYLVIVMTDLTSTECARYYDNNVTITSIDDTAIVTVMYLVTC